MIGNLVLSIEPWLSIGTIVLLSATLFHAIRLERRLGVLKRDRAALEALVKGFNDATVRAEAATARLRGAAEGAGRALGTQLDGAESVRADLAFLIERGEALADRLDEGIRGARGSAETRTPAVGGGRLLDGRTPYTQADLRPLTPAARPAPEAPAETPEPRLRSQAERDLLRALKLAR
jgi:hypothetical protein